MVVVKNELGQTLSDVVTLVTKVCGECGILFAVPKYFDDDQLQRGRAGGWYCPNGHCRVYTEREANRVRREMEAKLADAQREIEYQKQWKDREREERLRAERLHIAAKGQVTKLRRRVGNGVCPCCNRTFGNVQRHMKTQHPQHANAEATE